MIDLAEIGFYTLSNARALASSIDSPMWRCELLLTDKCNFHCRYCRGMRSDLRGVMPLKQALTTLDYWIQDGLKNVRFSGGEPCTYPHLLDVVRHAKKGGVQRIAISTNGSFPSELYQRLIDEGVNDFSISLDGCCSNIADSMSGVPGSWEKVVRNIRLLSTLTYVTVGMVFTDDNVNDCVKSVEFAADLGVSDMRVIPAAQYDQALVLLRELPDSFLSRYPILRYRVRNIRRHQHVRGLTNGDPETCHLVLDDMAVAGQHHFPCIIYLREGGNPIGIVGPQMRQERFEWMQSHNVQDDEICKQHCLDVCRDYNTVALRKGCTVTKEKKTTQECMEELGLQLSELGMLVLSKLYIPQLAMALEKLSQWIKKKM